MKSDSITSDEKQNKQFDEEIKDREFLERETDGHGGHTLEEKIEELLARGWKIINESCTLESNFINFK
jgi:hypothetical protein